jgi:bifunctional non-homologous end joining protein LigD
MMKLHSPLPQFYLVRMLQRTFPAGFIAPCLPTKTDKLPSGGLWIHEIKHDGFRVIARKDGERVTLYSRPGNDLPRRFPLIVEALARLRSRSCIVDGEAVACDDNGVASFDFVRHHHANDSVFLYAFDLIELNGDDLRRDPLEVRKARLASVLARASSGIRFNEHMEGDGLTVFAHACKLGLEGIVSKRKNSPLPLRPLARLAQNEERGCAGREARSGGGLGKRAQAMMELERKHLVQADRHIAECKAHIAHQRKVIETLLKKGHSPELAESLLHTLERCLRSFERHRQLSESDDHQRQEPDRDLRPED